MKISICLTVEISRKGKIEHPQSWHFLKKQVKQRDNATCRYCGEFVLDGHVDHIIPVSRGGVDDLDNLVWACPECNMSKGDKTLEEWGVTLLEPRVKSTRVEIVESKKPNSQIDLPVKEEILCNIASAVLGKKRRFSRRGLAPDVISECQFNKLLNIMLEEGLAQYRNDRPQSGIELTHKGKCMFQEFLDKEQEIKP